MRKVPTLTERISSSKLSKFKILSIASIGNCLELYDFTLYGIMLPFLAMRFFPTDSQTLSMFIGFVSFAISFIIAPIGSIFWGWYGDRFGRLLLLRTSMIIMAIPSLGIALLPDYQAIGIFAPILLILLRIMQGISASGEVMGAKIFAMELLGAKFYGTCSGVISSAGALGVLMAMSMGYIVASNKEITDLWRFPFLIGSLLFVVAYLIRINYSRSIKKDPNTDFEKAKIGELFKIIKEHNYPSLIVFILGAMLGILSYTMHAFINPFLIQQGLPSELVYQFSICGLVATMITTVLTGFYMDKYTTSLFTVVKTNIFWASIMTLLFYILLLQGGFFTLIGYIVLGGILGIYACISAVLMYRLFLPDIRCRGILFSYAMGCAIFGGITPLTLSTIGNIHPILPGIAVFICGMIILIIFNRSIKHVNLY
jgi:MFS family permease